MKLVAIVKLLSEKNRNRVLLCITFTSFLFCSPLFAQEYNLTFENTPLSDALLKSSKKFGFKVAFDAEKLGSVQINKEVRGNTIAEFVTNLLSGSGFEYQYKHNRFLIYQSTGENTIIPLNAQLIGSVSDKETGEQLPYATIICPAQNMTAVSSDNGSFSIKNIYSSPIRLLVTYIGYTPLDTTIGCSKDINTCNIKMRRKVEPIDSIVVKGTRLEMIDFRNDVDFATTINPTKLIDLPILTETDVFKTLQLLPGISYSENSSELSIRGGSSDQNLVLFDGQTLYNLSHYYGVISAINPNVIKDIQVYKGGYDSRYGERVSGIVDITEKSGNQSKPVVYGDLNLLSGNLAVELPVGNKITLLAAGRRSYSDIYSTGFADQLFNSNIKSFQSDSNVNVSQPTFRFYDYNTKATFRRSNTENFTLSAYGGKDFFNNNSNGNSHSININSIDTNTWSNYGASASWLKQWNGSLFTNYQIGTSGYNNYYTNINGLDKSKVPGHYNEPLPDVVNIFTMFNQNKISDFSASLRNILTLSNSHLLEFGLLERRNSIYYLKNAENQYVYDDLAQSVWTNSAYFLDRISVSDKLTIKPGLRYTFYSGNSHSYLEPRFAANYRFSNNFSVRVATGRYYQFLSQVSSQLETGYIKNFWVLADNSKFPVVSSNHYIVGSTLEKGKFLFDVEGYYKTFNGLQEYLSISQYLEHSHFQDYDFHKKGQGNPQKPRPSVFASGIGKSYGIDFLIRYKSSKYTSWISYSIGRSLRQFELINNNSEFPSPSDQTHQLSFTHMLKLKNWNLGAIILYSTGRPYIDSVGYVNNLPTIRLYKRLPNYFRTDLSANYNFKIRNARVKAGATIINLFNTQNYFDLVNRNFNFDNTSFSEISVIPAQSLSLNLFLHFEI